MAQFVNRSGKRIMAHACWSLWLLTAWAAAQAIPDPTRPPTSIGTVGAEMAASAVAGPVLQSVLISPVRKMAIISGQTVKLHGKFGDAHLIHIDETEVILRNGKTEQILKLFPEIKIRPAMQSVR